MLPTHTHDSFLEYSASVLSQIQTLVLIVLYQLKFTTSFNLFSVLKLDSKKSTFFTSFQVFFFSVFFCFVFVVVSVALLFGENSEAAIVEDSDSNDLDQVSLQVYPMSEQKKRKINNKSFSTGVCLLVDQALVSASTKVFNSVSMSCFMFSSCSVNMFIPFKTKINNSIFYGGSVLLLFYISFVLCSKL